MWSRVGNAQINVGNVDRNIYNKKTDWKYHDERRY